MLFSNYGDFQTENRTRLSAKLRQDRFVRRLIGMLGLQRKLKTILLVLLVIYLSINIYYTSRTIIQNEAQIAMLKKVLHKPLCVAHEKIVQRLRRLTKDLNYVRMSVDRDVAMARIIDDHSDNLRKLLREIELITRSNLDDDRLNGSAETSRKHQQLSALNIIEDQCLVIRFIDKALKRKTVPKKKT